MKCQLQGLCAWSGAVAWAHPLWTVCTEVHAAGPVQTDPMRTVYCNVYRRAHASAYLDKVCYMRPMDIQALQARAGGGEERDSSSKVRPQLQTVVREENRDFRDSREGDLKSMPDRSLAASLIGFQLPASMAHAVGEGRRPCPELQGRDDGRGDTAGSGLSDTEGGQPGCARVCASGRLVCPGHRF